MKTTAMRKIVYISLGILLVGQLGACKKRKYDKSDAPKNNAIVENAFDEMTNMSDQAIKGNLTFYAMDVVNVHYADKESVLETEKADCSVTITIDTVSSPHSVTIDWGTANCTCNDGKTRRGKIVTTFTGSYYSQGTVITHTPVNYYVNDNKVEGTKTVTNMGNNTSSQPYFKISISGVVTLTSGEVITYSSNRVRTFTAGFNTPAYFYDDEYSIAGSATATVTNGDSYTADITSPLKIKVGCAYIKEGVLELTPAGKPTRTVDYGDGTCDATFTIEVNGNTYTING